jgi:hypothetical protein
MQLSIITPEEESDDEIEKTMPSPYELVDALEVIQKRLRGQMYHGKKRDYHDTRLTGLIAEWTTSLDQLNSCNIERGASIGSGKFGTVHEAAQGRVLKIAHLSSELRARIMKSKRVDDGMLEGIYRRLEHLSGFCNRLIILAKRAKAVLGDQVVDVQDCSTCYVMTNSTDQSMDRVEHIGMKRVGGVALGTIYKDLKHSKRVRVEEEVMDLLQRLNAKGLYQNDAVARNIMVIDESSIDRPVLIDLDFLSSVFTDMHNLGAINDGEVFKRTQDIQFGVHRLLETEWS